MSGAGTAVITGANTGIGRATARSLAESGWTVVLACRSEERAAPVVDELVALTDGDRVEFLPLDLADLAAVRESADRLMASGRSIDLLVNNAGVAGQRGLTKDGFELTFGVNHVGHFLFTLLLAGRLTESAPTRIVNVSSGNHYQAKGIDFDAVRRPTRTFTGLREYNTSKLANVLFTRSLAERFDPQVIASYAVNPGPVNTEVWRRIPGPLLTVFKAVRRMKDAEAGARPSLYAATAPGIENRSGGYVDEDDGFREPSRYATAELGAELWRRSEDWVAPFRD